MSFDREPKSFFTALSVGKGGAGVRHESRPPFSAFNLPSDSSLVEILEAAHEFGFVAEASLDCLGRSSSGPRPARDRARGTGALTSNGFARGCAA